MAADALTATLNASLAETERRHLKRVRRTVERFPEPPSTAPDSAEVIVEGRRLVNFCGNDYLALSRHPAVGAALREAAARWGVGSGASHLVTGHGLEHERLEEALAAYVGRERALLFSTGYMANLAAVGALAGRGDRVLLDRLCHASLIDAAMLSGARLQRYPHADAGAAERMLRDRTRLIVTDGLFSMDGDLAPVGELVTAAERHGAQLIVDDAHGLGVLGASGRGTLEHLGVAPGRVPVLVGTLGKAFGTFGAFVAGSTALIETLIQHARSYIYTTALPHALAAAARAALEVSQREHWRRARVLELTGRFRRLAKERRIPLSGSTTPIQPIIVGSAEAALTASRRLMQAGFWVAAIRPPTVPARTARLRITVSAAHTEAQIDALVEVLAEAVREAPGGALDAEPAGSLPEDR
ncbi:MAG TPA: 8-amino-7-oxononanoate synthase [Steroidobacteraceae bacterium]|nr:8-amino-7-oxononanoate synthase [Steroidobacteraceae bacterium]